MTLTPEQIGILIRPINVSRIEKRKQAGMNLSYLSQHDVRAHLIRIFGFAGFDLTTLNAQLAFEHEVNGKWEVGYQVTMQLAIKNEFGQIVAVYSETAIGSSTQGRRSESHDMAMKTASSDAMKRCAINLGDQFGLSLYDNGSTNPIVRATLVGSHLTEPGHDAPQTPVDGPESDFQPHPGVDTETPLPADTLPPDIAAQIINITAITDNKKRILAVAAFKNEHPDLLDNAIEVNEQQITVNRYLDLAAAGQFTQETA